jgi:hypothetical protein
VPARGRPDEPGAAIACFERAWLLLVLALLGPGSALAQPVTASPTFGGREEPDPPAADRPGAPAPARARRDVARGWPYLHLLGGLAWGRGVRLNNPYRLQTELGDGGESLSLTADYLEAWAAGTLGAPDGLQHGAELHVAAALGGVPQEVLTPAYVAAWRAEPRLVLSARAGAPIVLEPDANVGGELAARAIWLARAGLGASVELGGSLFYGAATRQASHTMIPVVSLALGLVVDYEVLP